MGLLKKKQVQYILIGLVLALLPFIFGFKRATVTMLDTVVIYAIAALGFNILLGYSGQISLGHAAFMGIGAYLSAYITMELQLPFLLAILLSGVVPMLIGLLLGLVALRLEGHYLAIATLGLGVTIQHIFKEWTGFTGGFSGAKAPYASIFGYAFKSRESFFVLAIAVLVLLSIFAYHFLTSKAGRALVAMRNSEHAAKAMGVSLFKYKLIAFAVSAFYAGVAGSLYMHLIRYSDPNTWGIELSLNLLAMVVIGGLATIGGSILGAAFIVIIPELLKEIPVLGEIRSLSTILTGVALILVIRFMPYGLGRVGKQIQSKRQDRKNKSSLKQQISKP